ncbi:hypothetical protein FBU59_006873, partial [Linderina macrospora]
MFLGLLAQSSAVHQPAADIAYALISSLRESAHGKDAAASGEPDPLGESDNELDFDDEDSVPDPESFVVQSSDRPETFSMSATETLFADASVFAPSNALFLLDEYQRDTRPSLAAAVAIASAIKSRPISTAVSSAMVSGRASPVHDDNESATGSS